MLRRILHVSAVLFALVVLAPGCARAPVTTKAPVAPGTLHAPLSVQVTAAQDKKLMGIDPADMAELLRDRLPGALRRHGFALTAQSESARQHLWIHVLDAGRGTGTVNTFCRLEASVYAQEPGLASAPRKRGEHPAAESSVAPDGVPAGGSPLLRLSWDLKDRRRLRLNTTGLLPAGAKYFAEQIAAQLASIRADTPVLGPPSAMSIADASLTESPAAEHSPIPTATDGFEVAFRLAHPPGNLTLTPAGRLLVSLHQFFDPPYPVAEVRADGSLLEYAAEARLDSVMGIQSDENGVVWMLDNGLKSGRRPRLVGWHSVRNKLIADIDLSGAAPQDAFFNDLVVDLDHEHAYLADPAGGANAALVVVDLATKQARRLLQGHASVVPEDVDLIIDGEAVEMTLPDGSVIRPRVGVNPIAADADNVWLYFGPMHGTSLYRVETAYLRESALSDAQLEQKVERVQGKPISDGMSLDRAGNIYLGALAEHAIWKLAPDGSTTVLAKDSRLAWVNDFSFGPDGKLYAVVNQLHRSPPLQGGTDHTIPPYWIIALPIDAAGVIGR